MSANTQGQSSYLRLPSRFHGAESRPLAQRARWAGSALVTECDPLRIFIFKEVRVLRVPGSVGAAAVRVYINRSIRAAA